MLGAKQNQFGKMIQSGKDYLKSNANTKITNTENKKLAKTYENKITNVTIGRLVEGLNVHVMETKEIAPKIKEAITKYLIEAVNNINVVQN
jgi:hypothetical protein